ncbi:MAG: hypothetical protein K0B81_05640 [Candidatus Cloacimonetes bacterium]|nr:hypothetical protein [Candidatus Cloacimonadota bacterium]
MNKQVTILLLMLFTISFSLLWSDNTIVLWEKARAIVEANYNIVPGITHHQMVTTDDKSGKILQSSDVMISHQLNDEGEIVSFILEQAIEGEDSNHPDNDKMVKGLLERDLSPKREGIFFTEIGKNLQVIETDIRKEINGYNCREYEIKYTTHDEDKKEITFTGSVWLEENSGAPIYNMFDMDKTPPLVRELTIERWFHFDEDSKQWFLKEMKSTAAVRFLLKRMTNITSMLYSNHWYYPVEETEN